MGRYRKIDTRIWNDGKFCALSDRAKLVWFMLLTHPNMTALGAMRNTMSGLAEEMGWPPEAFREAFQEAFLKGMAEHDAKACLIALPHWLRYNKPESPNVVKAWSEALDLLPECALKNRVIARSKAFVEGLSEAFAEALPEDFRKAMPYQEQEQEQEVLLPLPPSSDPESEPVPKAPLKVSRRKAKPKPPPAPPGLYPPQVSEAVNRIAAATPLKDRQERKIKVDVALLAERLGEHMQNPAVTADLVVQSWLDYLATDPEFIKAPARFFGKKERQNGGEGAHWGAYAAMVWHREAKARAAPPASAPIPQLLPDEVPA